jgi:hypothetical protein
MSCLKYLLRKFLDILPLYLSGMHEHSLVNLVYNLQLIATQGFFLVQIRIWTCINNILKLYINIICGNGYFGVKCVIFFLVKIT